MNRSAHRPATYSAPDAVLADQMFDWKLDAERLGRAAQLARQSGTPDPWTLVEAECSLDLIDAELLALERRSRHDPNVIDAMRRLRACRARIALAAKTLSEL